MACAQRPTRASRCAVACLCVVVCVAAGASRAQTYSPMFVAGRAEGVRSLSAEQKQERQFLRDAAAHLRFVHAASKLALEKSTNAHVREVAAEQLNHAAAAQPEVTSMLHARGMAAPIHDNGERAVLHALQKSTGAKFDRMYLQDVALRAGQIDAQRYQRVAGVTRDAQLRAWIERQLPTLQYQLAMAARM